MTAAGWLKGVVQGVADLVDGRVVTKSLRTRVPFSQIPLGAGVSLQDRMYQMLAVGYREEALFLMRLGARYPLLDDLSDEAVDRFLGCEILGLEADDGEPLVLCAHLDWIAVGVPSTEAWDRDRLTVRFKEMLPDGTMRAVAERIDHLARPGHAVLIRGRHLEQMQKGLDVQTFWGAHHNAFPHLAFGPDVERQISALARVFPTVARRLAELDVAAAEWSERGGPAPRWQSEVSPESPSVMKNPRLRRERIFRSVQGGTALFEWHARFGNVGRIHLRFTASSREVEIGYIGPHLPL